MHDVIAPKVNAPDAESLDEILRLMREDAARANARMRKTAHIAPNNINGRISGQMEQNALKALRKFGRPAQAKEVAAAIDRDATNTSTALRRLAEKGKVTRRRVRSGPYLYEVVK